jgi:hypothetical protein
MRRIKRRRAVLGGIAAVALVGAGIGAVAATGQGSGRPAHHTLVGVAASYLGVPQQQLRQDLRSGKSLAEVATSQGRSQSGLIAALVAARKAKLSKEAGQVQEQVTQLVQRRRGAAGARGAAGVVRAYLGLTAAQLRAEIRSGKTLAQIANSTPGRSEAGLIKAIVAVRRARLAIATHAGLITPQRDRALEASLSARVKLFVNRQHHRARGA